MEAITVKQLIDSIGNLRIQLFDADSGILLADGRKASKKIKIFHSHLVEYIDFKPGRVRARIYKEVSR